MDKSKRRPVIDPFLLLLRSRRVLVALGALLVSVLILFVPAVEAVRDELTVIVLTLALALIGGYSLEDAASAARQARSSPDQREQIRELVDAILDESLDEATAQNAPITARVRQRPRKAPVPPIR